MKRTPLRRISDKRRRQLRSKAMQPKPEQRCELLPYLCGVSGWLAYRRDSWHPTDPLWQTFDPHHVWKNRASCDEPWNVVTVCRPVHEFCENAWQQAGTLVCMKALHDAERFDPVTVMQRIGKDPLGVLENWLADGLFAREAVLKLYTLELLDYYGRTPPSVFTPDGEIPSF